MVIAIDKLPVGSFTFLQCLSGTELPNLSGTAYINADFLYISLATVQSLKWVAFQVNRLNDHPNGRS
jgi:hypothetical protein